MKCFLDVLALGGLSSALRATAALGFSITCHFCTDAFPQLFHLLGTLLGHQNHSQFLHCDLLAKQRLYFKIVMLLGFQTLVLKEKRWTAWDGRKNWIGSLEIQILVLALPFLRSECPVISLINL